MPTKEEMRSLAEEIVRSYEDRIGGIARVKESEAERKRTEATEIAQRKSDVSTMLKGFDAAHAAMSNELKADLAKVAPALRESEAERKRTEATEIAQRKSDVSNMLKGFDETHAAMSKELRAKLAGDEQERRTTTAQEIAQRKSDVGTMLKGFDDSHTAMSKELKADLAKVAPALREAEAERKLTATQEIAQRKSDVSTMLKGFDDSHAAMSKELRAKLAGDEQERRTTTAQEIAQRKSDVSTTLKGFREEQAGVRDEWQKMTAIMQSKRGGVAVAVKPPIEEIAEVAAAITTETTVLRGQVFEYLANHPDGTRLVGLAEEFGIARIQMANVIRKLLDENKVEKRELLYFAV